MQSLVYFIFLEYVVCNVCGTFPMMHYTYTDQPSSHNNSVYMCIIMWMFHHGVYTHVIITQVNILRYDNNCTNNVIPCCYSGMNNIPSYVCRKGTHPQTDVRHTLRYYETFLKVMYTGIHTLIP